MRTVINISLPPHLKREVDRAIRNSGYATKSEFFRGLLRMWQKQKSIKVKEQETDLFAVAVQSGVFDFYQKEPDLYSERDIKERL